MEWMNSTTQGMEGASAADLAPRPLLRTTLAPGNHTLWFQENSSAELLPEENLTVYKHPFDVVCRTFTTGLLAWNMCLGVECIVGFVLGALFLYAVRVVKELELGPSWCLSLVIATDMAVSFMHFSDLIMIQSCKVFNLRSPLAYCVIYVSGIIVNFWAVLPSMLSNFTLTLDQFSAILCPLHTRLKSRIRIKRILFSLIIWSPSIATTIIIFGILWPEHEEQTCFTLTAVLDNYRDGFSYLSIICLALNVISSGALLMKLVIYTVCHRFKHSNLKVTFQRQRRNLLNFFIIVASSLIFWLPFFVFMIFTEPCLADEVCREWEEIIYVIMQMIHQINGIFNPLFLAWRFPSIGKAMFGKTYCRG